MKTDYAIWTQITHIGVFFRIPFALVKLIFQSIVNRKISKRCKWEKNNGVCAVP